MNPVGQMNLESKHLPAVSIISVVRWDELLKVSTSTSIIDRMRSKLSDPVVNTFHDQINM